MCGGGPLFDDAEEAVQDQTADQPRPLADESENRVRTVIREMQTLRDQARRDYYGLRGYIENYRTRADSLEAQVRKWCDEIDETAAKHERTVDYYMRRYNHLESVQGGLVQQVRRLELALSRREATHGCSRTCYCQDNSLLKKITAMEGKMQRLEDQSGRKDREIERLNARYNTLEQRAARHEQELRDAVSSASLPQPRPTRTAASATTTDLNARLTNLTHVVDQHNHYFGEIRDRILQQEDAARALQRPVVTAPESRDLEQRIEEAVTRLSTRIIDGRLETLRHAHNQWADSVDDDLAKQARTIDERGAQLEQANKRIEAALIDSREQTHTVLVDLQSSLEEQIEARRTAATDHINGVRDHLNERLANFAMELQNNQLDGMQAEIQKHAGQIHQLEVENNALGFYYNQQRTATQSDMRMVDTARAETLVSDLPTYPTDESVAGNVIQFQPAEHHQIAPEAPMLEPTFTADEQMADVSHFTSLSTGNQNDDANRSQSMAGNAAQEHHQAGHREPQITTQTRSIFDPDDLYCPIDELDDPSPVRTADESMGLIQGIANIEPTTATETVSTEQTAEPAPRSPTPSSGPISDLPDGTSSEYRPSSPLSYQDNDPAQFLSNSSAVAAASEASTQIPGLGILPTTEKHERPSSDGSMQATEPELERRASQPAYVFGEPFTPTERKILRPVSRKTRADLQGPPQPGGTGSDSAETIQTALATLQQIQPPQPSNPVSSAPTPAAPATNNNYSVAYIKGLRAHVIRMMDEYLPNKFDREICDGLETIVKEGDRNLGPTEALAERAGLFVQDSYSRSGVEQIMMTWVELAVFKEAYAEFEVYLPATFFAEVEKELFVEEYVGAYLREHPADC